MLHESKKWAALKPKKRGGRGQGPVPFTQLYSVQRRRDPGVEAVSEAGVSSQILNLGLSCLFDLPLPRHRDLHCI